LSATTIDYCIVTIDIDKKHRYPLLTMCFNQQKSLVEFPNPNDYVDRKGNFDDSAFMNALFMYELFWPS